ncbi:hypothetical protein Ancab_005958 [Ancistrocladus abbreviatus]
MTKILANELKGTKITANCAAHGIIATELVLSMANKEMFEIIASESPLLRLGEPKDIVAIIEFLVSDDVEALNTPLGLGTFESFEAATENVTICPPLSLFSLFTASLMHRNVSLVFTFRVFSKLSTVVLAMES